MPFIMNALETPINTQAHGKWFQWKPRQIKEIQNPDLALFFTEKRGEEGLVGISDNIMELPAEDPSRMEFIEERRKEGVQKRINKLDSIINNLEQSLRYDLEAKNMKADPLTFASKGELSAYKERATLSEFERKQAMNVGDEIRKLKAQIAGEAINGSGSSSDSGTNNPGRPSTSQPAQSRK